MKQFALHAQHFGVEITQGTVKSLGLSDDNYFKILHLKKLYAEGEKHHYCYRCPSTGIGDPW